MRPTSWVNEFFDEGFDLAPRGGGDLVAGVGIDRAGNRGDGNPGFDGQLLDVHFHGEVFLKLIPEAYPSKIQPDDKRLFHRRRR